jgi:crotonobetainyl-CoA:carnitine CoA-transferase CaiB-like acyl-CoA transferase
MGEFALEGIRVVEVGDEKGEFLGKLLAGFGADVVKVEPPEGAPSRRIGPFYRDDPDAERSLFFWHFNQAKRGLTLDLERESGQRALRALALRADIFLETFPPGYLADRGLGDAALRAQNPALIYCSLTDFGQDGPWAGYTGSDLIHLAVGGPASACGYPRDPVTWEYPTPPMTPRMWHAYHFAGSVTMLNLLAAVHHRDRTGLGQYIDASVHEACANANEFHTSNYLADGSFRGRRPQAPVPRARDGRYIMPFLGFRRPAFQQLIDFLDRAGHGEALKAPEFDDDDYLMSAEGQARMYEVVAGYVAENRTEEMFHAAQASGLTWAPVRAPEDNLDDPHYTGRGTFAPVDYPELGLTLVDAARGWVAPDLDWRTAPRAPHLGEHNAAVAAELGIDWPEPDSGARRTR